MKPNESRGISRRGLLSASVASALAPSALLAGSPPAAAGFAGMQARQVPARLLPVPDTVSDALKPAVAAPLPTGWDIVPTTADGWRAFGRASGERAGHTLDEIQQKLGVTVESATLGGVPVFISTPDDMPETNRNRVLMHLHGGGYVLYPGKVGAGEGIMMSGYGRFKVISVDYRMSPDFPFPAPVDDTISVWKAILAGSDPRKTAIFGTSAGGGLTLATLLRARTEGLPFPAAIAPGSPWADLAAHGDSIFANAFVDNVLVSMEGWAGGAARLYAGGEDLKNPLISPIYGDFTGFPPAILTSGTRDLLLSDTVRTHRKLRQAGIEAILQLFEAQSHAQFLTPFTPETAEAFGEIASFFDKHLDS